jgi:hypothetical protein
MTRAINLRLPEAEVKAACATAKVAISAIETLPSGGTHLVCLNIEGADEIRLRLKKYLIEGRVKRFPFMVSNRH